MKWKSLLAAALTAAVAWPALAQDATGGGTPSLSFSFANNRDGSKLAVVSGVVETDTELGVEPVPANKWIELYDSDAGSEAINNTETISANDERAHNFTLESDVTVTYSAKNAWSVKAVADQASSSIQPFLQSYLDDGDNPAVDGNTVGAKFTVTGIPFESYDVIIYFASDKTFAVGSDNGFLPVTVNGTVYSWTQWKSEANHGRLVPGAASSAVFGSAPENTAILGKNAIRVPALSGDLIVTGTVADGSTDKRCCIAGFQIVEAEVQPSISVNMKGNQNSIVGTSGFSGLISVPNANWNELSASGDSEESPMGIVDNLGLATTLAIDATYSGALWSYSSAGRPTLGDMANGYREVTTLDLSAVPYSQYDLILYYASDRDGTSEGTSVKTWAPVKITSGETVSYYTYTTDHATGAALKVDETDAADWGTTASCKDTEQSVAYGGAVMLIEGLSGDITLEMLKTNDNRGALYGFQIVCTGDVLTDKEPIAGIISVNARGTKDTITSNTTTRNGTSGLEAFAVSNANWNELTKAKETETITGLKDSFGVATTADVTAYLGGKWGLSEGGGMNLLAERTERLGAMGDGYNDAGEAANPIELAIRDVPYETYDLVLYLCTDNDGQKWVPVEVISNGVSAYYTYTGKETDGAATKSASKPASWGTTNDIASTENSGTLGHDVMLIKGLSGDIEVDMGTHNPTRGGLAGFQIIGRVKEIVPPTPEPVEEVPSLNVNFASGRSSGTDYDHPLKGETGYGLYPVPGGEWDNVLYSQWGNAVTLTTNGFVVSDPVKLTFQATGAWEYPGVNNLLVNVLDDAASNDQDWCTDIDIANVPFTEYSAIVYLYADAGVGFRPVEVNGKYYTYKDGALTEVEGYDQADAFGNTTTREPVVGVNAVRVDDLTGAFSLRTFKNGRASGSSESLNTYARGNLAGFQLICTGEVITVDPAKEGVISLNFGSNRRAVPEGTATYGLVPVAGDKWQNFSGESGTNVAIMRAENTDLAGAPTVTYSASTTWYTDANDAHPFLQGYLDDGATEGGYGATISVANLPYSAYDVIVYAGYSDNGEDNIQPYEIDGTLYRWDDAKQTTVATTDTSAAASWGSLSATPAYGENALRVRGRLASPSSLTVKGLDLNGSERGGIAALQIVERKLITENFANALDALAADTPVYIMPMAPITGDLTLPDDAVLDLRFVSWETPVVSGTLTLGANTMIRLPSGRVEYAIAGAIAGAKDSVQVFVHDDIMDSVGQLADGVTISSGGTITRPATYEWVGGTDGNNWSNPANWSSGVVPGADSEVTVSLNADDAKTIVVDTAEATANLFYISGPQTGSATLEIVAAENVEGAKLTVVDKMFTMGNVTVTQNANIGVAGTSQMGDGKPIPTNQVVQASFQVNGANAKYTIESGALVVQVPDSTVGDVSVSNGATLEVGTNGTLTAARAIASYFGNATSAASGTLSIAGTATFSTQMGLSMDNYTVDLAGGTMTTPSVRTFHGLAVSAPSVLKAPDGKTLTVSSSNGALTGEGDLTLEGAVTFSAAIPAGYTGELTVADGATVTLGENRPALTVVDGARVNITPTAGELADGRIAFGTSMAAVPNNVTFAVDGVEAVNSVVKNRQLTLVWEVSLPTISADAAWGTADSWSTGTVPATGTVVLDGTAEGGITVTLDTAIPEEITSIILRGDVTLVTSEDQGTIPASVTFGENVVLTVGAVQFASGWTLPSGATLKVTNATTSLFGVTLNGVVELAFSGTTETPATYSAPVSFLGGLTVSGSDVSITDVQLLGDAETRLTGDNVSLTFSGTSFYTRTTLINEGAGNQLLNIQNLNGEILANAGTLTLEVALVLNEETSTEENPVYDQNVAPVFKGLTIAEDATVTFIGVGTGGQFAVTGAGTLDMGIFRKQLAGRDGTLVKNLRVTATDDEQKAGEIRFLVQGSPALPDGFQVVVTPAEGAAAWEPTWDLNGQNLVIRNVPPTPVMSVTGNWSAGPWSTGTAPTTGEVILDGGSNGIVVTMDTALDAAIAVTVRGAVTLKTSATQTTLPDNITLEEGASLGVEYAAATTDDISDLAITRGLAITGDNVTVTAGTISGAIAVNPDTHNGRQDTIRFYGDNGRLTVTTIGERSGIHVDKNATGNVLVTETFTSGTIVSLVSGTSLSINTCTGLGGVDIQANATLTLTADCTGGELHATGAGILDMSAIAAENRPTIARWSNTVTNIPATIRVTASEAENTAGKVELDLVVPSGNNDTAYVTLPEGFVAQVTYGLAQWDVASTVISEDHSKLVITKAAPDVSPSLPEGSTLSETATAALNTAATEAGFTGEYAVAITTGGATVQVTTAEAATQLQEVLDCFTGLTLKASTEGGNTVTVVYDFGVVGIKRNTSGDGWVVTAKVQGENAAPAGFAAGNYYVLSVTTGETGSERRVVVQTVDESNIGTGTVVLTLPDTALEGVGEPFTLGVKVSRPEQTPAQ